MRSRKAINFDLDTQKLEIFYPHSDYRNAYRDIQRFMTKAGFIHRQGSGYISKEEMDNIKVSNIVEQLTLKYDWLKYCVKEFDVTDIGDQFSLLAVIQNNAIIQHNKEIESDKRKVNAKTTELQLKKSEYKIKKSLNKEKDFEL